jgi:long-chain acyl-CoA synthetase
MMAERTLAQIVEGFYQQGSDTAYVCRRGYRILRWSYRKIAEVAYQLAREFQARGIGSGDKVVLWGDDGPEWVVSFFACVLRGAVVVPMDRSCTLDFVQRVSLQIHPRLFLCSQTQPKIGPEAPVLTLEFLTDMLGRHPRTPLPLPDLSSRDPVEIVFTSGTTADPKGVILSHKNILTNLDPLEREIGKYLKYERIVHPVRFLNLVPLSHVFGQFLGLFIPPMIRGTVVFSGTLNPSEIIHTIRRERISVLVAVPRIIETLQTKIERDMELNGKLPEFRKKIESAQGIHFIKRWWRFRSIHRRLGWKFWALISGGASLNAETEMFWGRLGFAVIQGYGLTETTSIISINHPFKLGKGSIGKVLPGREVKLAQDGEILVRGDSIAKTYIQGQERKPVSEKEGWFHTGDIGALDEQGNLYFKGRQKSVIVSPEGMNIFPEDLEAAVRSQPEVRDCVVVGLERGGNAEACAVLILRDKDLDPEAIVQSANQSLAEYQHIRRWLVWPEEDFPRTATQKPQTKTIQQYARAKIENARWDEAGGGLVADLITRITMRRLGPVTPESRLETDLNLSSIERVELLGALEDRFQLDLNESSFASAHTIGDLERLVHRHEPQDAGFKYPRWAQSRPIAILRILIYYLTTWSATMIMAHPRIRGRENLDALKSPLLFISNHITQVDVGFVMAALPRRYRHRLAVAMLGEMLRDMRHPPPGMPFVKRLVEQLSYWLVVALFNVFPLPQKSGFLKSFRFAGDLVDRGYSVLVFPEGMRTQDGIMSPFRSGVGLLAMNLDIPVVPIRIDGLYELKKSGKKLAAPGTVKVTIGPAVRYDPATDPFEIARDLEMRMAALI